MIPHRMLSNEISGSGLRDRVTACRKRLRENRVILKAHATTGVEELFPHARMDCSPLEGGEPKDNGMLLQTEEQGVGIT